MKCVLMNRDIEIFIVNYNSTFNVFDELYEVLNIRYAPLILKNIYEKESDSLIFLKRLSEWFHGRGIPSWRDYFDLLFHRLNIYTSVELLDKIFGLSLD